MPKLIDYGVRFELVREAVVRVTLRDGTGAVTVSGVAADLQVSPATLRRLLASPGVLPWLGLQLIARRQRTRRLVRTTASVMDPAHELPRSCRSLELELPVDEERAAEARAWAGLTSIGATSSVEEMRVDRATLLSHLVGDVLDALDLEAEVREVERVRLQALVDGLSTAAAGESATPDLIAGALRRHMFTMTPPGLQHVA